MTVVITPRSKRARGGDAFKIFTRTYQAKPPHKQSLRLDSISIANLFTCSVFGDSQSDLPLCNEISVCTDDIPSQAGFLCIPIKSDYRLTGGLNGGYRLVGAFIIAGSSPLRARFDRGAISDTQAISRSDVFCNPRSLIRISRILNFWILPVTVCGNS